MKEAKLKGKVLLDKYTVGIEFGRYQTEMSFSRRGTTQRQLRLSEGDIVEIIIRKA